MNIDTHQVNEMLKVTPQERLPVGYLPISRLTCRVFRFAFLFSVILSVVYFMHLAKSGSRLMALPSAVFVWSTISFFLIPRASKRQR